MKNLALMASFNTIWWWLVVVAYLLGPPCTQCIVAGKETHEAASSQVFNSVSAAQWRHCRRTPLAVQSARTHSCQRENHAPTDQPAHSSVAVVDVDAAHFRFRKN